MSTLKNNIYKKYIKEALKEHIPNEKRIKLFNEITPLFLNDKLSIEEFSHIASNLYFKKEWTGIEKNNTIIDWIMYFGADSTYEGEEYKKKLKLYYEAPDKFEKWWTENIASIKKS